MNTCWETNVSLYRAVAYTIVLNRVFSYHYHFKSVIILNRCTHYTLTSFARQLLINTVFTLNTRDVCLKNEMREWKYQECMSVTSNNVYTSTAVESNITSITSSYWINIQQIDKTHMYHSQYLHMIDNGSYLL